MFSRSPLAASSILALGLATGPASADMTAQQVWSDWKSYLETFGYEISASEATSGDTLTVADVSLRMEMDENDVAMDLGTMTLTNLSDGTVQIGLPDSMPIDFAFSGEMGEDVSGTLNYANTGLSIIASGDPEDMRYDYTATTLDMSVGELTIDGESAPLGNIEMSLKGVEGSTSMKLESLRNVMQDFTADELTYDVDVAVPEEEATFKMSGALNDLTFDGSGAYPLGKFEAEEVAKMLKAGFTFSGSFGHEGGETTINATEEGKPFNAQSSSESGALDISIDEDHFAYGGTVKGLKSTAMGADIPFPLEINAEESGFELRMPIAKAEEPQDYKLSILLGDFTTSEMLWGMIDPQGQLPRDPATIELAVSGQVTPGFDMLDPEQMDAVESGEAMPGEIQSANIDALKLSIAGAELTGDGGFTFDNSDMQTFPGMPRPSGAVDLKLTGGNGLLDKLVGMGLLPEEQASGARMMMGLFAVPVEGEDTLNSKIEINDEGQVLANGQRLR